jgi:hypothetical protein
VENAMLVTPAGRPRSHETKTRGSKRLRKIFFMGREYT